MNDYKNSTRYKRQKETKDVLAYIHGGMQGAIFGAWDFSSRYAGKDLMEKIFLTYKRGKFLENLYGKFSNVLDKSEMSMKKALATKYYLYLSRRKYTFLCKIQKSIFDPETESWVSNRISYGEYI